MLIDQFKFPARQPYARKLLKNVRAKMFYQREKVNVLLRNDNDFFVSEMEKKLEVADFVSEIKRLEYPP